MPAPMGKKQRHWLENLEADGWSDSTLWQQERALLERLQQYGYVELNTESDPWWYLTGIGRRILHDLRIQDVYHLNIKVRILSVNPRHVRFQLRQGQAPNDAEVPDHTFTTGASGENVVDRTWAAALIARLAPSMVECGDEALLFPVSRGHTPMQQQIRDLIERHMGP